MSKIELKIRMCKTYDEACNLARSLTQKACKRDHVPIKLVYKGKIVTSVRSEEIYNAYLDRICDLSELNNLN